MDTLTHALADRGQTDSGDKAGWLWADWRENRKTRKPTLLFRLSVLFLLRAEERTQSVLLFHEPPRITRRTPCPLPD